MLILVKVMPCEVITESNKYYRCLEYFFLLDFTISWKHNTFTEKNSANLDFEINFLDEGIN